MYSSLLWEVFLSIKGAFELQILNFVRSVGNFIKTKEQAKKEQTKSVVMDQDIKKDLICSFSRQIPVAIRPGIVDYMGTLPCDYLRQNSNKQWKS